MGNRGSGQSDHRLVGDHPCDEGFHHGGVAALEAGLAPGDRHRAGLVEPEGGRLALAADPHEEAGESVGYPRVEDEMGLVPLTLELDELAKGQFAEMHRFGGALQLEPDPSRRDLVGIRGQGGGQLDRDRSGGLRAADGHLDGDPAAGVAPRGLLQPPGQQVHVGNRDHGPEDRPEESVDQPDAGGLGIRVGRIGRIGIACAGGGSGVGGHRRAAPGAVEESEQPRGRTDDHRRRLADPFRGLLARRRDAELGCGEVFGPVQEPQLDGGLGHVRGARFGPGDCLLGIAFPGFGAADARVRHDDVVRYLGVLARLVHQPRDERTDHHSDPYNARPQPPGADLVSRQTTEHRRSVPAATGGTGPPTGARLRTASVPAIRCRADRRSPPRRSRWSGRLRGPWPGA